MEVDNKEYFRSSECPNAIGAYEIKKDLAEVDSRSLRGKENYSGFATFIVETAS